MKTFLNKYATPDHPDITDEQRDELMESHFYYIQMLNGYFVPNEIEYKSEEEKEIHMLLHDSREY